MARLLLLPLLVVGSFSLARGQEVKDDPPTQEAKALTAEFRKQAKHMMMQYDFKLPRLHLSVDQLGDRLEWHPCNYWYCPPGKVLHDNGHGNDHVQAIFRRELLDRIGGYPDSPWSGHEDADFTAALKRVGLWEGGPELQPEEIFYLYRWGVGQHLSGLGGGATMQRTYDQLGAMSIIAQTFVITPHWMQDYVSLVHKSAC